MFLIAPLPPWYLKYCLSVYVPQDCNRFGFLLGLIAERDSLWCRGKRILDLDFVRKVTDVYLVSIYFIPYQILDLGVLTVYFHDALARRELFTKLMKRLSHKEFKQPAFRSFSKQGWIQTQVCVPSKHMFFPRTAQPRASCLNAQCWMSPYPWWGVHILA